MRVLPVIGILLTVAACGDPLAGIDRLSDVDVVDTTAAALPDADEIAREGFFGTAAAQGSAVPVAAQATSEPGAPAGFLRGLVRRAANADPAAAIVADLTTSSAPPASVTEGDVTEGDVRAEAVPVVLAALPPDTLPIRTDAAPRRLGLFGGGASAPADAAARNGPDARDVPFGTALAFGEIARVCEARGQSLGQRVDSNGQRGFALYDSAPGSATGRTFYVTGFGDDCPRQFTAANALFGAPSFYEVIRFGPTGENLPYAATDQAYDKVKSSICGASKNKPCGAKIDTLDSNTAFLSAYEFGEINDSWKEFLVHDGIVLAAAVKSF
jgi:hypothetical protein